VVFQLSATHKSRMQSGLNSISMPVGVMEKALYSFYTRNILRT
jgi:hypothetical protein